MPYNHFIHRISSTYLCSAVWWLSSLELRGQGDSSTCKVFTVSTGEPSSDLQSPNKARGHGHLCSRCCYRKMGGRRTSRASKAGRQWGVTKHPVSNMVKATPTPNLSSLGLHTRGMHIPVLIYSKRICIHTPPHTHTQTHECTCINCEYQFTMTLPVKGFYQITYLSVDFRQN